MNFKKYVLFLFTLTFFNMKVKAQKPPFYSEVVSLSDVNGLIIGGDFEILVSSRANIYRYIRNATSSPFYSRVLDFQAHDELITAMYYLPEQGGCVSASTDRSIKSWGYKALGLYTPRFTIKNAHSSSILCFYEISYAKLLLASGASDGEIKIWNPKTGALNRTLNGHETAVTALCATWDGTLFSSSTDGTIRMWNSYTGDLLKILTSHTDSVNAMLYLWGYMVSVSSDKSIKIWNAKGDLLKTQKDAHNGSIHALEKFGNYLMTSGSDKTIKLWYLSSYDGNVNISLEKTLTSNINETVFRLLTVSDKYGLFLTLDTSPNSYSRLLTWKLDGLDTTKPIKRSNGLSDAVIWIIIIACLIVIFGGGGATYAYREHIILFFS